MADSAPVTAQLIERLLYESESTSLDFKRDQYPYAGTTDALKAVLVKDILAFANSIRDGDAYILIGVHDTKTGRAEVIGVDHHLEDANLQALMRGKCNRDLMFAYHIVDVQGKSVGVIRIPTQEWGTFLIKPFGVGGKDGEKQTAVIEANTIYYRRNSMNAVASPLDIISMAKLAVRQSLPKPDADFSFGDPLTKEATGVVKATQHLVTLYDKSIVPNLAAKQKGANDFFVPNFSFGRNHNADYWREAADYANCKKAFVPLWFRVVNCGSTVINDVIAEISLPPNDVVYLLSKSGFPKPPDEVKELLGLQAYDMVRAVASPTSVHVAKRPDKQVITVRFGKLHAGQRGVSVEPVYFSPMKTIDGVEFDVILTADEFQQPKPFTLTVTPDLKHQNFTEWKPLRTFIETVYDEQM